MKYELPTNCPKCQCNQGTTKYLEASNKLLMTCRRCEYQWTQSSANKEYAVAVTWVSGFSIRIMTFKLKAASTEEAYGIAKKAADKTGKQITSVSVSGATYDRNINMKELL